MVKLTLELLENCVQRINPVREYELDLRGYKIPVIENLGCTLDQFDCIDFSDNDLRKLDGFPQLRKLNTLLLNNNRICRVGDDLHQSLPNLKSLMLTNNNVQELPDIDVLVALKQLEHLSLLRNPVASKKHYRQYVIYRLPQLRVLDFRRIRLKERQEAERLFRGSKGEQLVREISVKTFVPGESLPEKRVGPSREEVQAIKRAIAEAQSFEEVERLQTMLQSGVIPGHEEEA